MIAHTQLSKILRTISMRSPINLQSYVKNQIILKMKVMLKNHHANNVPVIDLQKYNELLLRFFS